MEHRGSIWFLMQKFLILLFLVVSTQLHAFTPYLSFSASKSELIKLYSQHRILPLSGLQYEFEPDSCAIDGFVSQVKAEPEKILWRYLVPELVMGQGMKCMTQKVCFSSFSKRYIKGPICCRKISPRYKKMNADMHNIIPTAFKEGTANLLDSKKIVYKGSIARIYLYMQYQYGLHYDTKLLEKLQNWHKNQPPTRWEKRLNRKIFQLQGTFNPYIEKL